LDEAVKKREEEKGGRGKKNAAHVDVTWRSRRKVEKNYDPPAVLRATRLLVDSCFLILPALVFPFFFFDKRQ
jgi:hypothetical protein